MNAEMEFQLPISGWLAINTIPCTPEMQAAARKHREAEIAVKRIEDHQERIKKPARWYDRHR